MYELVYFEKKKKKHEKFHQLANIDDSNFFKKEKKHLAHKNTWTMKHKITTSTVN
jgi:hypothetical protein